MGSSTLSKFVLKPRAIWKIPGAAFTKMGDIFQTPPAVLVKLVPLSCLCFLTLPTLSTEGKHCLLTKSQSSSGKFQEDESIVYVHF